MIYLMTREELNNLTLNQRVVMFHLDKHFKSKHLYGYVVIIYNGNYQVKVWFDGELKPRVVGYSQINLIK